MVSATRDSEPEIGAVTTVLDHGYVKLVESWGSDARIIEAARMSTSKGFQGWGPKCEQCRCNTYRPDVGATCPACGDTLMAGDEKLLLYLYTNAHHTPFEMAGAVIEVQAPIFVFREWHRHRTQSYNELSARYTALPDLFYVPSVERMMAAQQSSTNKQGSTGGFTEGVAELYRSSLREHNELCRAKYEALLAEGVAREIARVVIPVAQYSRMRASANLRNWLAFLTLRMAPNAQWEIRQYAQAVHDVMAELFPRTLNLFSSRTAR